jgi:hypothetical protein
MNIHLQKYFLIFCSFLLICSCKKDIFDYRNKYNGTWEFAVDVHSYNMSTPDQNQSYSYNYIGKITNGEKDNNIFVEYDENSTIELTIDKDGTLSSFPSHYSSGKFEGKNKIHLFLQWGGLGGWVSHTIEGKKE